jgi:tetratricopeptide (TPR) repeat protein
MRRFSKWVSVLAVMAACSSALARDAAGDPGEYLTQLRSDHFQKLDVALTALQRRYERGSIDEVELRDAFNTLAVAESALAPKYDVWVEKYPRSYAARLAKAIYYRKVAQDRRGGDTIDNTSAKNIEGMEEALKVSLAESQTSIALTARPLLSYIQMIVSARLLGFPDHGRRFLDSAVKIAPRTAIARGSYLMNLAPRWGGSVQEMEGFVTECQSVGLSQPKMNALKAIVAEEQGWEHLYVDEDAVAAERDFDRADSLSPNTYCSDCERYKLAELFEQLGNDREAIIVFSKILANKPDDVVALSHRGIARAHVGLRAEAVADYRRAAQLGDMFSENEMGRAYAMGIPDVIERDMSTAVDWFAKAAAQGDDGAQRNLELAKKTMQQGQ